MKQQVIVFDFDKTLSCKDSLVEIFKHEMHGSKIIYRPIYFIIQVLAKFHILSRDAEKSLMIHWLFKDNEALFKAACENYADKKDLNPIYQIFIEKVHAENRVIVLSASAQYFLDYMFRDVEDIEIIGTTFQVCDGIIQNIIRHPSGSNKRKILDEMNVSSIEECYYDSKSDECLLPISKKYFKIKNGKIVQNNE